MSERTMSEASVGETLTRIWQEILYRPPESPDENFFDAGADSLQVIEFEHKIRTRLGMDIPIETMTADCTIRTLTGLILAPGAAAGTDGAPQTAATIWDNQELPLLQGQRSLLEIEQLPVRSVLLHTPYLFAIQGPLDAERLRQAIGAIVDQQPFLRCALRLRDGAVAGMRLVDRVPVELPLHDLSTVPVAEREGKVRELLRETASREFDVEAGPLFAAALARMGPEEHALIFVVHHLVFDNPSMRIFFPAVFHRYASVAGGAAELEPFALTKVFGATKTAEGAASVPARTPAGATFAGARHYFTIDAPLAEALKKSSQTAANGCLAAFFSQLLWLEGGGKVTAGTSLDVRKMDGLEGIVGCLLRHAELTCEAEADTPLAEIVEQARVALNRAMDQASPHIGIVPGRQAWPYSFVFYTGRMEDIQAGGLKARALDTYQGWTKRDLTARVVQDPSAGTLQVCLEYSTSRFSRDEIAALADSFLRAVRDIAGLSAQKSSGAA